MGFLGFNTNNPSDKSEAATADTDRRVTQHNEGGPRTREETQNVLTIANQSVGTLLEINEPKKDIETNPEWFSGPVLPGFSRLSNIRPPAPSSTGFLSHNINNSFDITAAPSADTKERVTQLAEDMKTLKERFVTSETETHVTPETQEKVIAFAKLMALLENRAEAIEGLITVLRESKREAGPNGEHIRREEERKPDPQIENKEDAATGTDEATKQTGNEYDIANGFTGMMRDLILRLIQIETIAKNRQKMQAIFGMNKQHLVWLQSPYYIEGRAALRKSDEAKETAAFAGYINAHWWGGSAARTLTKKEIRQSMEQEVAQMLKEEKDEKGKIHKLMEITQDKETIYILLKIIPDAFNEIDQIRLQPQDGEGWAVSAPKGNPSIREHAMTVLVNFMSSMPAKGVYKFLKTAVAYADMEKEIPILDITRVGLKNRGDLIDENLVARAAGAGKGAALVRAATISQNFPWSKPKNPMFAGNPFDTSEPGNIIVTISSVPTMQ
ncbi:hypothetical protein AGMMS50296_0050 [Alphaproteobacteria bacterium]|nr:hypothetical protein AGMMS50296_0050 [Alphaproteobacteria bacterium]